MRRIYNISLFAVLLIGFVAIAKSMTLGRNNLQVTQSVQANTTKTTTVHRVSTTTKSFTVTGADFYFKPNQLVVRRGSRVNITFDNVDNDDVHNLTISGYNVHTANTQPHGRSTISFVANKTGTYTFYCSMDNHRQHGMTGKFVVQG